ncbi:MAG: DNA polymerase III subunit gamma/tau [Candidatus Paceibacterota bacterium]
MENLVLYRKYRPQTFADVVGQDHVTTTIANEIKSGHVAHAYLFSGPRGCGKTTTARIIAKAVNCLNRKPDESEPCNHCANCLEISSGRAIDLIEIDAASHRGIDDIRELREGIKFAPTKLKYKVFIIDECHQLSKDAANALLKTLEEPPGHAIFILATTELHKILPTILSRCQRFDFRKLALPEMTARLQKLADNEGIKVEKTALELVALSSGGSVRDAESLLGQVLVYAGSAKKTAVKAADIRDILGIAESKSVGEFIDIVAKKNASAAINYLNVVVEKGYDVSEYAKSVINYLRQMLILSITSAKDAKNDNFMVAGYTDEEFELLRKQTLAMGEANIKKTVEFFLAAQEKIKYSPIPQLPLELAIVDSCAA